MEEKIYFNIFSIKKFEKNLKIFKNINEHRSIIIIIIYILFKIGENHKLKIC